MNGKLIKAGLTILIPWMVFMILGIPGQATLGKMILIPFQSTIDAPQAQTAIGNGITALTILQVGIPFAGFALLALGLITDGETVDY